MIKRVFALAAVCLFSCLAVVLSTAAFADPHVKIEITSLYAAGNQLSVTMNIINDGDSDCTVTNINMQNIEIWDNDANMNAFFTIENMSIYVEADHYVTKTYDINLPNYVPHEFINPGFKFKCNISWRQEQGDDEDDEDDDGDGEDDVF